MMVDPKVGLQVSVRLSLAQKLSEMAEAECGGNRSQLIESLLLEALEGRRSKPAVPAPAHAAQS